MGPAGAASKPRARGAGREMFAPSVAAGFQASGAGEPRPFLVHPIAGQRTFAIRIPIPSLSGKRSPDALARPFRRPREA